jgi:hypothetical protein
MSAGAIGRIVVASLLVTASAPGLRPALAEPLLITDTKAPDLNCLFNQTCKIAVTDSVGVIPITGISGRAVLQSRTFFGIYGTPAAGLTGYLFRVDLTQAMASTTKACVTRLTLDLGPLRKLAYPGGPGPGEVFVITAGAIGTVGLMSADRHERAMSFTFASPVCPGAGGVAGSTSYFFGFAAAETPQSATARVELDNGQTLDVAARAPGP